MGDDPAHEATFMLTARHTAVNIEPARGFSGGGHREFDRGKVSGSTQVAVDAAGLDRIGHVGVAGLGPCVVFFHARRGACSIHRSRGPLPYLGGMQ